MKNFDQLKGELENNIAASMAERVFVKVLEDYNRVVTGTNPASRVVCWELLAKQVNETQGKEYVTLRQDARIYVLEIDGVRLMTVYRDSAMALKVDVCQGFSKNLFEIIFDMFTNAIAMVHLKGMMANVRKEAELHKNAARQPHPFFGLLSGQQTPQR